MLQRSVVAVDSGKPVVAECDTGQIHPRFGRIDDAGQTGKGQVTAQNAVRSAPPQGLEQLLRAGHQTTVAHRAVGGIALP